MSLIYIDGFDGRDYPARGWIASGGVSISGTTPWSSGFSISLTQNAGGSATAKQGFTAVSQLFLGLQFRLGTSNSTRTGVSFIRLYGDNGATNQLNIQVDSAGHLLVLRGATTVITGTTVLQDNAWYFLELSATISTTTGSLQLRLNGHIEGNFSGNTKNGGTNNTLDALAFASSGSTAATYMFDDLYVCDATGSRNNTFLGMIRIQTLLPTSAGSSTQFTPTGSANNYANVNDVPDTTTTYNSDTVSGHRDTYTLGDLVSSTATVLGVQQVMHAQQLDAGVATIKQAQLSAATISYGSTKTLTASNLAYSDLFEANPATSSTWTVSDVNSLEAGMEIV